MVVSIPGGVRVTVTVQMGEQDELEQDEQPAADSDGPDVVGAVVGAVVGTAATVAGAAIGALWDAVKPSSDDRPAESDE